MASCQEEDIDFIMFSSLDRQVTIPTVQRKESRIIHTCVCERAHINKYLRVHAFIYKNVKICICIFWRMCKNLVLEKYFVGSVLLFNLLDAS